MKVYISGKITGLSESEYLTMFSKAQEELTKLGYEAINPALVNYHLPKSTRYEEYMKMSFCMLDMADAIYMLKNWNDSKGANRELGYAMAKDKVIMYE